jgi:hypothetical protein
MIKIDDSNKIEIKVVKDKVKIILKLKKDYNKNYQIEFMLDEINLEDLISQLLVAKVDMKNE